MPQGPDSRLVTALAPTLDAGETLLAAFPGHTAGAAGASRARVAALTDRRVLLCKGKLLDQTRVGRVVTAISLAAFELERRDGYVRIGDEWIGAHLDDELALRGQRQFEAACAARAGKPTPPRLRLVDPQ